MVEALVLWLNREKAAFLAAAAWLLLAGISFQSVPRTRDWGPPRVTDAGREPPAVSLEPPPPLGEFLAGARGNPFSEPARALASSSRRPLPVVREERAPVEVRKPEPRPQPTPPPTPKPVEAKPVEKPKPYELPVRAVGRISVGGADGRTVFVVKEDGRYLAVKEGEELPGLGVKLVSATKNVIIVENEKGARFRLTDLLRAKAASGEGSGSGE